MSSLSLPSGAGCFGEARPGGGVQAHSAMVTCVDALEPSAIVSSGMEGTVHRWDFRKLATQVSVRTRKRAKGAHAGDCFSNTRKVDNSGKIRSIVLDGGGFVSLK